MIWSHVRSGALAAVVLTATLPVAAAAAPFNYTFDVDAQGWFTAPGSGLLHSATGGNDGGFIAVQRTLNVGPGSGSLTTSLALSRAISFDAADYGGTFSVDAKVVSQDPAIHNSALSRLNLVGTDFVFRLQLSGPLTTAFGTSSFTLGTADNWSYEGINAPTRAATEADFLAYLPLVTSVSVFTSFKIDRGTNGAVSVGFDNISLTAPTPVPTPVPEPATLTLLGAGLASVVARRYRRR
jgi:PEP-CTERM motif